MLWQVQSFCQIKLLVMTKFQSRYIATLVNVYDHECMNLLLYCHLRLATSKSVVMHAAPAESTLHPACCPSSCCVTMHARYSHCMQLESTSWWQSTLATSGMIIHHKVVSIIPCELRPCQYGMVMNTPLQRIKMTIMSCCLSTCLVTCTQSILGFRV